MSRSGMVVGIGACALLALCFLIPYGPPFPTDELVKTSLWGLALLGSYGGWGTLIARACWPAERVGISLRIVWGASAFTFFGGVCAMVSGVSKALLLVWIVIGAVLLAHEWFKNRERLASDLRVRLRATRLHLPLAGVVLFLAVVVAIHYLGGAADVSSNPYDDDISYYPFARQLLDRGTLIDPFSFRRMSTLGGQAIHHTALLIRVQMLHLNVFDRAMCFVIAVGLLASHRVEGRKAPILARLASVAFLVVIPNTSINSASYYSGLAFFLAFFQTLAFLPESKVESPRTTAIRLLPLALMGAALCAQRQNYQANVGLVLVFSYGLMALRKRKGERKPVLLEGALCLGLIGLFVLPWLILLYRSNETFLFPLMKGTFRAGVEVKSRNMTGMKLMRFFSEVWLAPYPVQTVPIFMLVGLFVRETSGRRPLAAQWLSAFFSIVLLCQAFSLSDAGNLARYVFGFATASALLTWQTVATNGARARTHGSPFAWAVPIALLAFALSAPLLEPENRVKSRKMIATRIRDIDELTRRTVPAQPEPPIAATYRRMQGAVPAGARLLVLVDEPYFFDYARNEIWNLDLPGTASPKPGIPCFQGPEPVADYLISIGIKHLAFVHHDRSAFLYQYELWTNRIYDPEEIWRIYAPYIVDVSDNLLALSKTRAALHEEEGMVVLDLTVRK